MLTDTQTSLNMRKKLRLIYLFVISCILVITAVSLIYSRSHMSNIVLVGIALISIILPLVPYLISMYVFKKYEAESDNKSYKIVGIALYLYYDFRNVTWNQLLGFWIELKQLR